MKQTTISTSFKIIKSIKTVAEKLENSKLDATTLTDIAPLVSKLTISLNAYETHVPLLCVIYILDFLGADVLINDIVKYLDINLDQKVTVQTQLNEMVQNKLLNSNLTTSANTDIQGKSTITYKINSKIATAILNNSVVFTNLLDEPMDIFKFSQTIRELVDFKNEGFIDNTQLINAASKLENVNAELSAIRELAEYDLRLIDRIILYYLFDLLIDWRTGSSFNLLIKPLFGDAENAYLEIQSFTDEENDLINLQFITIRKSQMFDDYYLQLTPETIVSFLVEQPKLYDTNNQLISNQRIQVKDTFFHNN